jgi:hypothetical protein
MDHLERAIDLAGYDIRQRALDDPALEPLWLDLNEIRNQNPPSSRRGLPGGRSSVAVLTSRIARYGKQQKPFATPRQP